MARDLSKPSPSPAPSEFRPGSIFAERYKIDARLGSGPDSTVYRAEDLLTTQTVALKLVAKASAGDDAVVLQYRLELNLFRQAHQESLVRIFESGEFLGRLYLAMELIDGITLRDHLKTCSPIPIPEFAGFFTEMCDALGALHGQHIIHRDIHPGNIMVTRSGGWKLMDFGIGRNARKQRAEEARFAAPEQMMGQPPSFSVDIHALGAVSFEMLTGRQHRRGRPARDAPMFLEQEIANCPVGLASLIETCVHMDCAKRFQNAQALKTAAAQIFHPEPAATGRRLEEFHAESGADPQKATVLFARILRALIQLHDAGRKHEEPTPRNIWVNGDSIAIESSSRGSAPPSQSTLLIADARYAAPELVMARAAPDEAAHISGDIYVLGFVFYELLAGKKEIRRQFAELELVQTGLAWMRWHADPKLKLLPLSEVSPGCPKDVLELIERMVEKDPLQRVRTLQEALEVMDRVNERLATTQSFVMGPQVALRKPKRRTRAVALAVFIGLIVLSLIAGGRWYGSASWLNFANRVRPSVNRPVLGRGSALPPVLDTATGIMMLVREGEFVMGDDALPDAAPTHTVTLPAYYIDRLEVSNRSYRKFCARTGHPPPAPPSWETGYAQQEDYPVVNVGRDDAAAFCRFAGKRLPSEEEWEKAARGSGEPVVLWGNWTLAGLANLKGSGTERPSAVGSFPSDISPFGVLDLAGNVQEWVAGDFKSYRGAVNPRAFQGIVRGGGFRTPARQLSPASRESSPLTPAGVQLESTGFRCVVDPPLAQFAKAAREPASGRIP